MASDPVDGDNDHPSSRKRKSRGSEEKKAASPPPAEKPSLLSESDNTVDTTAQSSPESTISKLETFESSDEKQVMAEDPNLSEGEDPAWSALVTLNSKMEKQPYEAIKEAMMRDQAGKHCWDADIEDMGFEELERYQKALLEFRNKVAKSGQLKSARKPDPGGGNHAS